MTIAAETNKVTYNCDGSKTEFDFTFKVFQTSDIKVILITVATGTETVLTETTHYAVTGSLSSGGKVTTVSTYSSLYKIFITIDIDLDQETDLVYGGSYSSEAIETMSDKLTKIAQQFFEKIKRSITFKMSSDSEDIEIEDLVAGKTIVVNSAGDGLEMGESGGSGGGGLDNVVEDTTPQLGGNLDMNGYSIGGNTESQFDTLVASMDGVVYLESYGGAGDDSTNNLSAFNSAISALGSSGGVIQLGNGIYRVGGVVNIPHPGIRVIGRGMNTTVIKTTSASLDILKFTNVTGGGIHNLTITTTITKTNGSAIYLYNSHNITIQDVKIGVDTDNNLYDGIETYSGTTHRIFNFEIRYCNNTGLFFDGLAGSPISCYVNTGTLYGCGTGILLKSISGGYFSNIDIMASVGDAVKLFPNATKEIAHVFFTTVLGDTAGGFGWNINSNGGKVFNIDLNSCWGSTCGEHGAEINSADVADVNIIGGIFTNNQKHGIHLGNGKNVRVIGVTTSFNSQFGSGSCHGIAVAPNVNHFQVIGCNSGKGTQFGTNNQGYGIFIAGGSSDHYSIMGNLCEDNVIDDISDGGTGVNKSVFGNSDGGGGGGLDNIVEDTTPQLGGNLDMNGKSIGGNTEAQIDDAVSKKHTQLCEAADFTKLDGIETGATKYPDTGEQAFLDGDHTKLNGIEESATADQTKADIDGLGLSHDSLVDVSANDHHAESHNAASHSDVASTGANIDSAVSLKHAATLIGTKTIDETDIANSKVIAYNSTSGNLEYEAAGTPDAHASSHENAGGDEISVAALSGLLADDQHVLDTEVLAVAAAKGANADITSMTGLDDDGIPLAKVSGLGTAATRNAEDTMTDGSNLPDGAAIKTYGDANWGSGGGGGISWSLIDSNTNAVKTNGYLINASGNNVTLTLPPTPSEGDLVGICDVYNKATTNTITVARNTKNIEGVAEDLIVDNNGSGFTLVYTDVTRGWEIVSEIGGDGGGGTPGAHASSHENAGGDEISVAALSGLLADDQHVLDTEVLAVAAAKGVNADITSMTGLSDAGIPLVKVAPAVINAQTGTTYTFVLTDSSKLVTFGNANAITVTIPTNASVAFPIGTQIDCIQILAGKATFGGAGVTINSKDDNKAINGQWVGVTLIKTATNTWSLMGDLIA